MKKEDENGFLREAASGWWVVIRIYAMYMDTFLVGKVCLFLAQVV